MDASIYADGCRQLALCFRVLSQEARGEPLVVLENSQASVFQIIVKLFCLAMFTDYTQPSSIPWI
jgi:hypothetical protein